MRYALYYVPETGSSFNDAGSRWLGRDAYSDRVFEQPGIDGLTAWQIAERTLNARRYGFHATLKAPAPLAGHVSEADYVRAVAEFCKSTPAVVLPKAVIQSFSGIYAIVPAEPFAPLNALEKNIVMHFEPWRGGLNDETMEKQRRGNLTDRQIELLERWGYAHAMEEFRFHITLTDRIPDDQKDAFVAAMKQHFEAFDGAPLSIDRLGIFVEDQPGAPFRILDSFPLEGAEQ